MNRTEAFNVVRSQREPEPRMELSRDDTGAVIAIDAAALLAQYRTASGDILLICDEDCPYEEQLHIVLVHENRAIDHLVIGAPYTTGHFVEVGTDGDVLRFRFASDEVLRVEADRAGSRLPARLPAGAHRPGRWLTPRFLRLTSEGDCT